MPLLNLEGDELVGCARACRAKSVAYLVACRCGGSPHAARAFAADWDVFACRSLLTDPIHRPCVRKSFETLSTRAGSSTKSTETYRQALGAGARDLLKEGAFGPQTRSLMRKLAFPSRTVACRRQCPQMTVFALESLVQQTRHDAGRSS
jgi:hypothetical protein